MPYFSLAGYRNSYKKTFLFQLLTPPMTSLFTLPERRNLSCHLPAHIPLAPFILTSTPSSSNHPKRNINPTPYWKTQKHSGRGSSHTEEKLNLKTASPST